MRDESEAVILASLSRQVYKTQIRHHVEYYSYLLRRTGAAQYQHLPLDGIQRRVVWNVDDQAKQLETLALSRDLDSRCILYHVYHGGCSEEVLGLTLPCLTALVH